MSAYRLISPQTLKTKLFFSMGVLFLLIGILSVVPITLTLNYERKEEILLNLSETIRLEQKFVDTWFEKRVQTIQYFASLPSAKQHNIEALQKNMQIFSESQNEFTALVFVDKNGITRIDTNASTGVDLSDREYFKQAQQGHSYITDVFIGRVSGKPIIIVSSPVMNERHEFLGVIFGSVELTTVNNLMKQLHFGKTGETYLIDKHGLMLTESRHSPPHTVKETGFESNIIIDRTSVFKHVMANAPLTESYKNYRGVEVFGTYRWVKNHEWAIIGEIEQREVFGPFYHLLFIMGIIVFLVICVSLFFIRSIIKQIEYPIHYLLRGAKIIESGHYSYTIDSSVIQKTPLEMRQLCETYNRMSRALQHHLQLLAESEERYRSLFDLSPQTIGVHSEGVIVCINQAGVRMLKEDCMEKVIGTSIYDIVHPDFHGAVTERSEKITNNEPYERLVEQKIICKDGTFIDVEITAAPIVYNGKNAIQFVVHDVTAQTKMKEKLKKANETLLQLSIIDGLTGIYNRRYFDQKLKEEWEQAAQASSPFSLVMFDIDQFKLYNDTYGHQGGDECLKRIARAVEEEVRQAGSLIARYGGEEFACILPNTDTEGALLVAEKIRACVENLQLPHSASKIAPFVTVSVGAGTMIPSSPQKPEALLSCADKALYHAKEHGRNQTCHYHQQKVG
ncbi:sensor domain-containing diguanylate cyclase [Aneurinibacillus sp. REN35]|uniref:sensor domain-containing diguanylate cyclase n=1 Tax=Aneurinibacillus sp. REN35 TaxID=3237286 RepID=UPI00352914BA